MVKVAFVILVIFFVFVIFACIIFKDDIEQIKNLIEARQAKEALILDEVER